jgi:hypothetical protein
LTIRIPTNKFKYSSENHSQLVSHSWLTEPPLLILYVAAILAAQTPDTLRDSTTRRVAELARQVEALRLELRRQADLLAARDSAAEQTAAQNPAVPDQRWRQVSGIASRPFLFRGSAGGGGAAVGGYVDLEFARDYDSKSASFTQHRLIPFIFADISDRLHFGTELEFEYGGPNAGARDDGEMKIEFAAIDLTAVRHGAGVGALSFRAGALLSPLGKFNLIHDSPVNDLTERPLVDQVIIPTTLTEAGVGVFGQVFPAGSSALSYEAYVVNGFDHHLLEYEIDPADSSLTAVTSIREARGSMRSDNNAAKSFVGRLGFSPLLGVELGASAHTGRYGDSGNGRLTIAAFDAIVARGRWELLGEASVAHVSVDRAAEAPRARASYLATVGDTVGFGTAFGAARFATKQRGAYVQLNYHFLQGLVRGFPNSTFTGVVRYDVVDLDAARAGNGQQRLSLGVNWRPIEQSAVKLDYQWNWRTPAGRTTTLAPTNRLVASVATYF